MAITLITPLLKEKMQTAINNVLIQKKWWEARHIRISSATLQWPAFLAQVRNLLLRLRPIPLPFLQRTCLWGSWRSTPKCRLHGLHIRVVSLKGKRLKRACLELPLKLVYKNVNAYIQYMLLLFFFFTSLASVQFFYESIKARRDKKGWGQWWLIPWLSPQRPLLAELGTCNQKKDGLGRHHHWPDRWGGHCYDWLIDRWRQYICSKGSFLE